MRLLRLRIPESSFDVERLEDEGGVNATRPRIALERDGAFYDVEALERAFGDAEPMALDPSDFQTRVATLRCAGLYDLDARLLRGERPTASRVPPGEGCLLAPLDTDRAAFVQVDVGANGAMTARLAQARTLLGDGAFVGVRSADGVAVCDVHLGAVLGDDLRMATAREARAAIMGYGVVVEWRASRDEPRGLNCAFGPALVSPYVLPKRDARAVRLGPSAPVPLDRIGVSIEDAIAFASRDHELRSGDLVTLGSFGHVSVALHTALDAEIEGVGILRTTPVPPRG
ncbi:MAG: fumarylacetoacetate hydrolase family protein [Polyangiaceae bacterium]